MPRRDDIPKHKLRPKKSGPITVVAVTPKTVRIEKDRINDTVSMDRVSIAWQKDKNSSPLQLKTQDKYVVDKIFGHSVANSKISHCVRWYGFSPTNDFDELEEILLRYYIYRYWKLQNCPRSPGK